jgi:hypothetical protein
MTVTLTEKQVEELFALLKGSDTVELKVTVPDSDIRSTADLLDMDPLNAELRQVVFFDTPDLTLSQAGVVVRARRIQGGAGDTAVKLRPINPDTLSLEIRQAVTFKVEVDAMPRGFVCSASMRGKSTAADIRSVILKQNKISSLFTKEQRDFYRTYAPEGLKLSDLAILGPINLMKLLFEPKELKRKFVAELWFYPDGARILELSTKCTPSNAFQVAAETRNYLSQHGIDLTAEQQPKTNKALKYFSSLQKKAAAAKTVESGNVQSPPEKG